MEFTDHLLVNLLANLVTIPVFDSKDAVIEFSKRLEAERILGVKPKVRPKDMAFLTSQVSVEFSATGEKFEARDYGGVWHPRPQS